MTEPNKNPTLAERTDAAALARKRAGHREDLAAFDSRTLSGMSDKALVQWQSQFERDEPQWRLAEHELKIREGKSSRKLAVIAIVVSLLSLLLSAWTYLHPSREATSTHSEPLKPKQ